jgi:hypothetical protein
MFGAVTQLASGALDAAASAVELRTLASGIELMIGVTNDLIDTEALREGRLRVAAAPTDLRACLAQCVPPRGGAGCTVQLDVALDVPPVIHVDALRLRQASARTWRRFARYRAFH